MKRKILITIGLFVGLYLGKWLVDSSSNESLPLYVLHKREIDDAVADFKYKISSDDYQPEEKQKFARVLKAIRERKLALDSENWIVVLSEEDADDNEIIYIGN